MLCFGDGVMRPGRARNVPHIARGLSGALACSHFSPSLQVYKNMSISSLFHRPAAAPRRAVGPELNGQSSNEFSGTLSLAGRGPRASDSEQQPILPLHCTAPRRHRTVAVVVTHRSLKRENNSQLQSRCNIYRAGRKSDPQVA